MSDPDPATEWVHDLQFGTDVEREEARRQIFARYYDGLMRLALSRMNPRLRRRSDESRAASALRTVFGEIEAGAVTPGSDDELHKLLAFHTIRKVQQAARYHTAAKRDYHRETADDATLTEMAHQAPDAAWLVDELEALDAKLKEVAVLWLHGAGTDEIAVEIDRSTVTVRERKRKIIERLKQRIEGPVTDE